MGTIEEIIENEKRFGWFWNLLPRPEGWDCEGHCGVDILAPNFPRPRAHGSSMMAALTVAIRERNRKYGKPTKYLPQMAVATS